MVKHSDGARHKGSGNPAQQRQEERYSQSNVLDAEQPHRGKAAIQQQHSMTMARHHEGGHAASIKAADNSKNR